MTLDSWLPFGKEDDPQKLYSALHHGVPEWMGKSLRSWQREILEVVFDEPDTAMRRFHNIEQDLRTVIDLPQNTSTYNLVSSVVMHFRSSEDALVLTDYLLSIADVDKLGGWESLQKAILEGDHLFGRLESTLRKSGSKWTIGMRAAGRIGLIQRVPEGVQLAAVETMRSSSHAGKRLAEAWGAAFGLEPDPAKAYGLAVKAARTLHSQRFR